MQSSRLYPHFATYFAHNGIVQRLSSQLSALKVMMRVRERLQDDSRRRQSPPDENEREARSLMPLPGGGVVSILRLFWPLAEGGSSTCHRRDGLLHTRITLLLSPNLHRMVSKASSLHGSTSTRERPACVCSSTRPTTEKTTRKLQTTGSDQRALAVTSCVNLFSRKTGPRPYY